MEYINTLRNVEKVNPSLYPEAIQREDNVTVYSNTNNDIYNRCENRFQNNERNNNIDPVAREMSNQITMNFNARIQKAGQLNQALEIIKNSVFGEINDENLYSLMINQAIQDEDKEIISSIANDERKHNNMLRQIYFSLTGVNLPNSKEAMVPQENTYINNLKNSLFGELEAARRYRGLLANMVDKENYNKIMEIMIDELTHANKYNYLIAKYLSNQTK